MGLFSMIADWWMPCAHQYRTVATMFDDKNNPKVTTIVSECEVCGHIKRTVIKAEGACQHKWETYQRNAVFNGDDAQRPIYHRVQQQCEHCGEERAVNLIPEGSVCEAQEKARRRKADADADEILDFGQRPQPS